MVTEKGTTTGTRVRKCFFGCVFVCGFVFFVDVFLGGFGVCVVFVVGICFWCWLFYVVFYFGGLCV